MKKSLRGYFLISKKWMRNLAPTITRQRLLIEGFYQIDVNEIVIKDYFTKITGELSLKAYEKPTIFSTREGKDINQGYDAFIPLIDSGISLYAWSNAKFLSLIIYTCKSFDKRIAILVTKEFFNIKEVESLDF